MRRLLPLIVCLCLAVPAASAAAAPTVVTLGFDGGLASQYAHRSILADHGVNATFYVSSGRIGSTGYMTWAQLADLSAAGNDVGGNGLDHVALTGLTTADQQHQVCDERTALRAHGFAAHNFAYPGGQWNTGVANVVQDCGYDTARTLGGLDYPDGPVFAETLPPRSPYATRAIQPRLDTPLSAYEDAITKAQSTGGWFQLVLHDVCDGACTGYDEYAINAQTLSDLLDWLATQPDVKVRSAAQALGQSDAGPPPPPPDTTPPTVALTAPADGATVTGATTLSATAGDDVGVAKVEFRVDGATVATDTSTPYSTTWTPTGPDGSTATITARATDAAGNTTTSTARTVTISAPPSTKPLIVTLGFDDGLASQYAHRSILTDHGVNATFYINTAKLGGPANMTWAQVADLAAAGNDIGGHTLDHAHLTELSTAEQQREICDDRAALVAHGFTPHNFAYPYGLWNAGVASVVQGCGYDTARTTGGLDYPDPCCVFAETIPPRNPYATRAFQPRIDVPLSVYEDLVRDAETTGGWLQFVLHDVCDGTCAGYDEYAINAQTLSDLLDWLATQPDVKVRSVAQALGQGSSATPTPQPADTTPPTVALTAPADNATVSGTLTLKATASDDVGVAQVRFLVDGAVVATDTSAPYSASWRSSRGTHTIVAEAADAAGNTRRSSAVSVRGR